MQEEIVFEKYRKRGAYHWSKYFGPVLKTDTFLRGRYQVVIHLLKKAKIQKSSSVLEIGCGDGALCGLIYKKYACDLTGVDPSADGIRFSREMFDRHKFKGTFNVSEGYRFDYPDGKFDIVVLADVIEHLQQPELMLQEIQRLLKPGGHAVITTPIRSTEFPEDKMHVLEFYPEELTNLCKKYIGDPAEKVYSHPVVWHELYSYGKKFNRSLVRLYCRVADKLMNRNVFFRPGRNSHWVNFRQQGFLFRKAS